MKAKLFTAVFGVLAFGFAGYGVTNYMAASPVAVTGFGNKIPEADAKNDALAKTPEATAKDDALGGDNLYDMKPSDRLADAMTHNLPPKFLVLRHGDEAPPVLSPPVPRTRMWLYFIPLAAWIGWVMWRLLRASQEKMATDEHR